MFTTHTPVPAGIDRFPRELIKKYFGGQTSGGGQSSVPVPTERILALGAETYEEGDPDVFNMAVMGMRLAQRVNGVSELHGAVSREMFGGLWPGFDTDEVPIGSITNGVHADTWVAREIIELGRREVPEVVEAGKGWDDVAEGLRGGHLADPPYAPRASGPRRPAAAARLLAPARRERRRADLGRRRRSTPTC